MIISKCIASAILTGSCGMSERLQDRTKNSLYFKISPALGEDLAMQSERNPRSLMGDWGEQEWTPSLQEVRRCIQRFR